MSCDHWSRITFLNLINDTLSHAAFIVVNSFQTIPSKLAYLDESAQSLQHSSRLPVHTFTKHLTGEVE